MHLTLPSVDDYVISAPCRQKRLHASEFHRNWSNSDHSITNRPITLVYFSVSIAYHFHLISYHFIHFREPCPDVQSCVLQTVTVICTGDVKYNEIYQLTSMGVVNLGASVGSAIAVLPIVAVVDASDATCTQRVSFLSRDAMHARC